MHVEPQLNQVIYAKIYVCLLEFASINETGLLKPL